MIELTEEQRAAIDRLQAGQADVSQEDRDKFMRSIVSVPKGELESEIAKSAVKKSSKANASPARKSKPVSRISS